MMQSTTENDSAWQLRASTYAQDGAQWYAWYQSNAYPVFFRHFPWWLTTEELGSALYGSASRVLAVTVGAAMIGGCCLRIDAPARWCEFSILLNDASQHHGMGPAIIAHIGHYCCASQGLRALVCHVSADDATTKALLEHAGFTREATHQEACWYGGTWHDEQRYVLRQGQFLERYGGT